MVFNPNNYKPIEPKYLPVVLLLDVSGSMYGSNIDSLYCAVENMIHTFVEERYHEVMIKVAIITFGGNNAELHTPYTDVDLLEEKGIEKFKADGMTPLGCALHMAKDMIDDRTVTSGKWYAPAVVLVSDGEPNDDWEGRMSDFINEGRSKRCQRLAVAIGADADKDMLASFVSKPEFMFLAGDADDIVTVFEKVTMSVSQRAASRNPDAAYGEKKSFQAVERASAVKSRVVEEPIFDEDEDEF